MAAKAQTKLQVDVHPAVLMAQSIIAGMREKTGRSLQDWLELVGNYGPPAEKDRRECLKTKHVSAII